MKDLGIAYMILGIRLKKTENGYALSQSHHVEIILKKFNSFEVIPSKIPYDPNLRIKNLGTSVSQEEHERIMGSVMFLMSCTRQGISYVVGRLSRYTHNPNMEHWNALNHLLKYLKGTMR